MLLSLRLQWASILSSQHGFEKVRSAYERHSMHMMQHDKHPEQCRPCRLQTHSDARTFDNAVDAGIDIVGLIVDQPFVGRAWSLVPWLMVQCHLSTLMQDED